MIKTVKLIGYAYLQEGYASDGAPLWEDENGYTFLSFSTYKSNWALMVQPTRKALIHVISCMPYEATTYWDSKEYCYCIMHSSEIADIVRSARDKDPIALKIESERNEVKRKWNIERSKVLKEKNRLVREERSSPAKTLFKKAFREARHRKHTIMEKSAKDMQAYDDSLSYVERKYKRIAERIIYQWDDYLQVRKKYQGTLKLTLIAANKFVEENGEKSIVKALSFFHHLYFKKGIEHYNKYYNK